VVASPTPETDESDSASENSSDEGGNAEQEETQEQREAHLSTPLWFGKHNGTPFQTVVNEDRQYLIWFLKEKTRHHAVSLPASIGLTVSHQFGFQHSEIRELYDILTEKELQSPGSRIVWFGRYKGHQFSTAYAAPGYIKWTRGRENSKMPWVSFFSFRVLKV
jgi:uncharacterized protein (DUF3820 family)